MDKQYWRDYSYKTYRRRIVYRMLYEAKRRAGQKGLPFNITKEDISIPEVCPVLGIPIFVSDGSPSASSPSLDRFVPPSGYIKGNVQVISWRANRLKNDATIEELEAVINYMRGNGIRTS